MKGARAMTFPNGERRPIESDAQVYRLAWSTGDWAIATVHDETGTFSIASSFGAWAFVWSQPGRGRGSLHDFLAAAHGDYIANKLVETGGTRKAGIEKREARDIRDRIWPHLRPLIIGEASRRDLALRTTIDEALTENVRLGFAEQSGTSSDGAPLYKLTEAGMAHVESLLKEQP